MGICGAYVVCMWCVCGMYVVCMWCVCAAYEGCTWYAGGVDVLCMCVVFLAYIPSLAGASPLAVPASYLCIYAVENDNKIRRKPWVSTAHHHRFPKPQACGGVILAQ